MRRVAGLLWLTVWIVIVGCIHAPWRKLGGVVPENVRYWERVVLASAAIAGCLVGATARDAARTGMGRSHASLARHVLGIPAGVTAALLSGLAIAMHDDWIGVVFVGFLTYWAGLDAGIGAWPLLCGRHYSFSRAIESEDLEDRDVAAVGRTRWSPWR